MRDDITTATLAAASAGVSQPALLLQIDWGVTTSRLCTHSTTSWGGYSWSSAPIEPKFGSDGMLSEITLWDELAAYRTLVLSTGLTDKRVRMWQFYVGATDDEDPVALFDGYADGCEIANGRLRISVGPNVIAHQFSPRERIGPRIGVNHLGSPGEKISWGETVLTLEPRGV